MPIFSLRIPNVHFTRTFTSYSRAPQALAQAFASEPHHTPRPTLNPITVRNQDYSRRNTEMDTDILPVDPIKLGKISFNHSPEQLIDEWEIEYDSGEDFQRLSRAAHELATTDVPVAFPTETVYGLGADATRSSAVRAIFAAKGRPADNPLIVHVHSLAQLRSLLQGKTTKEDSGIDVIPEIYKPVIRRFWPGPLTIILPNPRDSVLAPEVTAGLSTFGARMPRSILSLALIRLSGCPLAGPSANASTRPSPTAAEHVKDDLDSRIHTIIDGGPCEVGVESTVVDGLSSPPIILRPGGVTVEQLRQCEGWENVVVGYKDKAMEEGSKPRAPGMKYRHYSPKATVVLYESGSDHDAHSFLEKASAYRLIGIIRTKTWPLALGLPAEPAKDQHPMHNDVSETQPTTPLPTLNGHPETPSQSNLLKSLIQHQIPHAQHLLSNTTQIWDIELGGETEGVARGLFSALRELDKKGVEVIFVEGIDDKAGDDIAAAVMNRLRKAAEVMI